MIATAQCRRGDAWHMIDTSRIIAGTTIRERPTWAHQQQTDHHRKDLARPLWLGIRTSRRNTKACMNVTAFETNAVV